MGLVFSVGAHLFAATMPIVEFGQPELQEELLPKLVSGTAIGANAITEAGAGSDAFALATRARAVDDGYVLDGSKLYVTNGPVADVFVVYATENPKLGYLGISAFAVEATRAGVSVGRPLRKMGLTRSPMSEVYFSECKLPSRNLLGKPGQGAAVFQASMRWERACLFAAYVGMLERQLEQSVDHARERRQGGRAIGRYQAVSHRLVDMKLRLESSRLLLYRACWLLDRGDDAEAAISLSKLAISEAARQSSLDAIQLHGGMGYLSEPQIECMLRDSIPTTIFSGTSEVQRDLIARELGL
jgi:alkylation response protein AidB-like acyl-CoA dehydrogenase